MLEALALIVASLSMGLAAKRLRSLPDDAAEVLNGFVIQVCVPAMVLLHVPKLELHGGLVLLGLTPWLLTALSVPLVILTCRRFGWSRGVEGSLLLTVPLGNTSFIGYPMIRALLGEDHLPLAVVYDQLGSFVLLSSYGLYVVARYAGGATPTAREVAARMLRFPPFLALLVALVPFDHPAWLDRTLAGIGAALVPVVMFAVGLKLKLGRPEQPGPLAFALLAKMAILPAVAWLLAVATQASPAVRDVSVMESAMPAMITAGALAISAGFAAELSAAIVGYGILLGLVTLPLLDRLLELAR